MTWPARNLPSMSALRAFDAVARHGSLWQAAQELHRTPSAISHQLRFLERELGLELTERDGKGIELTPFGRRYAQEVRTALGLIAQAAEIADDVQLHGRLTISCTPGFATFWLCNHLSDFRSLYPLVRIKLVTPRRLDDVSDPESDVFIAFGAGSWPNHWSELLARVEFTPICSPVLLNANNIHTPEDLTRLTLLHLNDFHDWSLWFGTYGLPMPDPENSIVFSDVYLAQAAAIAGQGVAMGDDIVCGRALTDGDLVRPFDSTIKSPESYFLVCERHKLDQPIVSAFCNWLKASLTESRQLLRSRQHE